MNDKVLAFNGCHDAAATFVDKNNQLRIFEYERFCKKRYAIFKSDHDSSPLGTNAKLRNEFIDYIKTQLKEEPEALLLNDLSEEDYVFFKIKFPAAKIYYMGHHMSHCAGAYYMSGYDQAISFSLDGGGLDYVSNTDYAVLSCCICLCSGKKIEQISSTAHATNPILFHPGIYGVFGHFISEIKKGIDDVSSSDKFSLTYAGKVMGLSAYGKVRESWVQPIKNFYLDHPLAYYGNAKYSNVAGKKLIQLQEEMGIQLEENCFYGQDSYDLAATCQYVFEELAFGFIQPFIEKYNMNVVFSGGCALNVLFNQRLKKYLNDRKLDLYVPPFPSDCGLSFGHYTYYNSLKINPGPYCGIDILDRDKIPYYCEKYVKRGKVKKFTPQNIVDLLVEGKIGGVIRGYSEIGPRALGNRSIICDPSFPNMKDTLNAKVKFREWFRPFAPVCTFEDKDTYFDDAFESEYMSYAPMVKPEWREKLTSITHIDGTARLQTVREEQHKFFYDIMIEMKSRGKPPIILNTSFNIKGNPILTTVEDAFYVLENTELDFIVVEDLLFFK